MLRWNLLALLLLLSSAVVAEEAIYKWVDEVTGEVTYSSTPPEGVIVEQIRVPQEVEQKPLSIEQRRAKSAVERKKEQAKKRAATVNAQATERIKKREQLRKQLARAKKGLKRSEEELVQGQEPGAGDIQRFANGRSRLNENYFKRIAHLESRVEDAKKSVNKLRKELAALR